jgi:hypothetical protein
MYFATSLNQFCGKYKCLSLHKCGDYFVFSPQRDGCYFLRLSVIQNWKNDNRNAVGTNAPPKQINDKRKIQKIN